MQMIKIFRRVVREKTRSKAVIKIMFMHYTTALVRPAVA
jgi:hypothetical protein